MTARSTTSSRPWDGPNARHANKTGNSSKPQKSHSSRAVCPLWPKGFPCLCSRYVVTCVFSCDVGEGKTQITTENRQNRRRNSPPVLLLEHALCSRYLVICVFSCDVGKGEKRQSRRKTSKTGDEIRRRFCSWTTHRGLWQRRVQVILSHLGPDESGPGGNTKPVCGVLREAHPCRG